ncbi:histidine phosphatase family protein [Hyphomonas johnsonii]|uniref:histidine phosphatase family protein n=1 Tax=Hyphomonas johnsonii TaxID=81031 RepID=UPI000554B9B1|nr:histidine phosphatase family protein [Hyphomonas johnsonii]
MTRLIIVRHGNTFDAGDTPTRVGARTDLPLSSSGLAQAANLSAHFRDTNFLAAFCSPLQRTRQTARAILAARPHAPALLVLPFLTEIDYGPDENQPEDAVIARVGAPALAAWDNDAVPPPGWHVDPGALRAAWAGLLVRARALGPDATVLIVTSNGIARFLPDVVDAAPAGLDRKLKTGAWGCVEISGDRAAITEWNLRP